MHIIQPATAANAAAIARVHVASWQTTYAGIVPAAFLASLDVEQRAAVWQGWLAGSPLVFTATSQERLVGFASGGEARDGSFGCDGELYAIYLLPKAQRQGIGTTLLKRMCAAPARCWVSEHDSVGLLEQNPARAFYEAKGGRVAGSKSVEIGGASLIELAYTWPTLADTS